MGKVNKRIQNLRLRKRISVKVAAKFVGVPVSTDRDWEYGTKIQGEPYVKLAELFEVSVFYLLTGREGEADELLKACRSAKKAIDLVMDNANAFL